MAGGVEIITIFDQLPEMGPILRKAVGEIVRKTAFDIQAEAQTMAPIKSGFLKSSIYVVTNRESSYGQGLVAQPSDDALLPEVERPASDLEAVVAVGANYGVYVELGTVNQSAQPYMTPAAGFVEPQFHAALATIEAKLRENGAI